MAVGQDNLERDPRLARIYAAAGGEEPPAEFDAAIRAAARRAVGAGPAVAGAPPRARRNWYVPVSLAAVLVLSVSLVTLVHEEKGSDLTPAPASQPAAPPVAQAPGQSKAPDSAPMKDAAVAAVPAGKPEDAAKSAPAAHAAKERVQARETSVTAPLRNTEVADAAARAGAQRTEPASPVGTAEGAAAVTAAAPPAPAPPRQADVARDAVNTEAPRAPPAPAAKSAAAAPAEIKLSTPMVEGRAEERPRASERPALRSARRDAPGAAAPAMPPRPAWLSDLENQPAERWLERLAEFRREGRQADADSLLAEFRKRFPDHPVSR